MISVNSNFKMDQVLENEELIVKEVAAGNRAAYSILYRHYFFRLHRFVQFFCQHQEDTEEIIQDCFLKIWERRETLVNIQSFENYVFRMAQNRLFDIAKQKERRRKVIKHASLNIHTEDDVVEKAVIFNQYHQLSQKAIEQLSPRKKEIFLLSTQKGLSLDEIAVITDLSRAAVKKNLYSSIHFIKSYLRSYADWPLIFLIFSLFF